MKARDRYFVAAMLSFPFSFVGFVFHEFWYCSVVGYGCAMYSVAANWKAHRED